MPVVPGGALNIDSELLSALFRLVLLSIFVERALSVVFEWKAWSQVLTDKNLKAPIAVAVSILVCIMLPFDVLRLFVTDNAPSTYFGAVFTGMIVAGGSAGSIKLFQDMLGFSKQARDAVNEAKTLQVQADKEEAQVRLLSAQQKTAEIKKAITN
jgi:hypothetical protein